MADPINLNLGEALSQLVDANTGRALPFQAASGMSIAKTGATKDENAELLSVFSAAFPDQDFKVTDFNGQKGIESKPKLVRSPEAGADVPAGYSIRLAEQGIKDLQVALEAAKTDEERFTIATRLNASVQTQKAYKFGEAKRRSEAEYGVPELEMAINQVKNAERLSPFNPGTGMPSAQRMVLIQQLGVARTHAAARVQEIIGSDPAIAHAENLAKGTISEIQGRTVLEGRAERLDSERMRKQARSAAVASMDPIFLESVAALTQRSDTSPAGLITLAEQIYDKKMILNDFDATIAKATNENLTAMFPLVKAPKDREKILQVLQRREELATGNKEEAAKNMKIFSTVMGKNLDSADPQIPSELRNRYKKAQAELTARSATMHKDERDMASASSGAGFKRELLGEIVKQAFYFDVDSWNGLVKSDGVAKNILHKSRQDKKTLNLTRFSDEYLSHNDGRSLIDKGKALQAIIMSATESLPRSAILPIPSAESFQLEAQRMISKQVLDFFFTNPHASGYSTRGDAAFGEVNKIFGRKE